MACRSSHCRARLASSLDDSDLTVFSMRLLLRLIGVQSSVRHLCRVQTGYIHDPVTGLPMYPPSPAFPRLSVTTVTQIKPRWARYPRDTCRLEDGILAGMSKMPTVAVIRHVDVVSQVFDKHGTFACRHCSRGEDYAYGLHMFAPNQNQTSNPGGMGGGKKRATPGTQMRPQTPHPGVGMGGRGRLWIIHSGGS